jgi:hypothetical protein
MFQIRVPPREMYPATESTVREQPMAPIVPSPAKIDVEVDVEVNVGGDVEDGGVGDVVVDAGVTSVVLAVVAGGSLVETPATVEEIALLVADVDDDAQPTTKAKPIVKRPVQRTPGQWIRVTGSSTRLLQDFSVDQDAVEFLGDGYEAIKREMGEVDLVVDTFSLENPIDVDD